MQRRHTRAGAALASLSLVVAAAGVTASTATAAAPAACAARVNNTIAGLLAGDSQSYLNQDPEWTPTYGTAAGFGMTDLLTKAGVVGTL